MKADNVSPQEAEGPSKEAAPAKGEPGRKAETCTTNTDKVDREIEKLKEERDQLEQQIRTTKDPDKAEDLKRQLAQLENELRQKDNDAYRRQNAVISQFRQSILTKQPPPQISGKRKGNRES